MIPDDDEPIMELDNGVQITAMDLAVYMSIVGTMPEPFFEAMIAKSSEDVRQKYLSGYYKAQVAIQLTEAD